jgi:hypothetical protein
MAALRERAMEARDEKRAADFSRDHKNVKNTINIVKHVTDSYFNKVIDRVRKNDKS